MINAFLQWFDETRLWKWLSKNVIAHLTTRLYGYPTFPIERYFELRRLIETMSKDPRKVFAFVLADRASIASILIRAVASNKESKGYSHAGWLTVDPSGELYAVHMKGEGNLYQWLPAVLKECDTFGIVEFTLPDKVTRSEVMARINKYKTAPQGSIRYDFEQELADQASPLEAEDVYCSELVWLCLKGLHPLATSKSLGRVVFSPNDVVASGKMIWEQAK